MLTVRKITRRLISIVLALSLVSVLTGCDSISTSKMNELLDLFDNVDNMTILRNTFEGTSAFEPSEDDINLLKEWAGDLEYEEFNILEILDDIDIENQFTFNIDEGKSFQYVTDSDGNSYIYVKDQWNKVLNPEQPPVDTAEFIRAELFGLNDIDDMTISEIKEVIKVLSQNPNTEQSIKLQETLGISLEQIVDVLEGTEENNALTFSGVKVTESDIRKTLKQIGLTPDILDFSGLADFDVKEATQSISNKFTAALDPSTPFGQVTREVFGDIYNSSKQDFEESVDRTYYLIKDAIGEKTGTPTEEVDAETIFKYIEDVLKENGYEGEDGYQAITDLLDTIYENMTPEEQRLFRMYKNFEDGIDTDYIYNNVDTKTAFNSLMVGIRKELPPDQQVLLDMFMSVEGVLENYDYTSKENTLIDDVLGSLTSYFTEDQLGMLQIFRDMLS